MLEKNCKFSLKFEEKGRVRPDWTNIKRTICALSFRANRVNYIFTNEFMYSPNYLFLTITIYTPTQNFLPSLYRRNSRILNWHSDISRLWFQSFLLYHLCMDPMLWLPKFILHFLNKFHNFTTLLQLFYLPKYPIFSLFKCILCNSNSNSLPWSPISFFCSVFWFVQLILSCN